jgi:hypothetical protein
MCIDDWSCIVTSEIERHDTDHGRVIQKPDHTLNQNYKNQGTPFVEEKT